MNDLKIQKIEHGHKAMLNGEDISVNIRKIDVKLDADYANGSVALVNMEFLAEVDIDVKANIFIE